MSQSKGRIGVAAVILGVLRWVLAIILARSLTSSTVADSTRGRTTAVLKVAKRWSGGRKNNLWRNYKGRRSAAPAFAPVSSKVVFIATAIVSLIGIAAGLIASWRDRSYMLGGPAVLYVRWLCFGITFLSR